MTACRQGLQPTALSRLSLNSFWLLAARLISQLLGLLFTLAIARGLGEVAFGQFAFISAVVFAGNVLTTFGMDTLIVRDVAASRQTSPVSPNIPVASTKSAALLIQLSLSTLFIVGVWFVSPYLSNQTAATLPALRIASFSLIPLAFSTIYSAVLRGYERMAAFMVFGITTALASGLGGVFIWRSGGSLTGVAWVLLIAQIIGALSALALCNVTLPASTLRWGRPSASSLGRASRLGIALAVLMVLAMLYQRSGVFLLSFMIGDEATGFFSAASRIMEALKMIPAAFFGALFPIVASGAHAQEPNLYSRSFATITGISIALSTFVALLAGPITHLLYGPAYEPAVLPLQIMSVSLPITVLTFKLSFDLVVDGKEVWAALSMFITLVGSIGVTILFIQKYSLIGAAAALIFSEMIQVVALLLMTRASCQSIQSGLLDNAQIGERQVGG